MNGCGTGPCTLNVDDSCCKFVERIRGFGNKFGGSSPALGGRENHVTTSGLLFGKRRPSGRLGDFG
jgi:hypothetical protein